VEREFLQMQSYRRCCLPQAIGQLGRRKSVLLYHGWIAEDRNAQGHLQLLAKYPSDPVTVFALLGLNSSARPFFPTENSRRKREKWHQELVEMVNNRYMTLMELASSRDDEDNKQYKVALLAASDLLLKTSSRRFYMDTILPMLELIVKEKPPKCVWPWVRKLHYDLCAATWPATGMVDLLRDHDSLASADSGCFETTDSSNWFGAFGWQ
jgi:hypothetical protein